MGLCLHHVCARCTQPRTDPSTNFAERRHETPEHAHQSPGNREDISSYGMDCRIDYSVIGEKVDLTSNPGNHHGPVKTPQLRSVYGRGARAHSPPQMINRKNI